MEGYVDPLIGEAVKTLASKKFKSLSNEDYFVSYVDSLSKMDIVVPMFNNYRVFYKQAFDLER